MKKTHLKILFMDVLITKMNREEKNGHKKNLSNNMQGYHGSSIFDTSISL